MRFLSCLLSGLLPLFLFVLGVAGSGIAPRTAAAIVAIERDFPELVARAEQIVSGTVIEIREDGEIPGGPYTFVTLGDLTVLKGDVGSTLTLRFSGGTVGTTKVQVSDMPTFTLGEKAILFVAGNGRDVCPLVGIWQGRFRARYDESVGDEIVEDHSGAAIVGRRDRELSRRDGKRRDQRPLRWDEFRQLVADELATPTR